jgi:Ion transport protein
MTATTPGHLHALSRFEKVALAAIIANTIVLLWGLIDHHHEHLLARCEYGFLLFFVAELGVRLHAVGWRPHHFLARPWNAFDTAVIALAFLPVLGVSVTLLRVARLARVVHTLRHTSHLRLADLLHLLQRKP